VRTTNELTSSKKERKEGRKQDKKEQIKIQAKREESSKNRHTEYCSFLVSREWQ
jgi:hypothetical protein